MKINNKNNNSFQNKLMSERYNTKSVVISRKPGKDKDGLWRVLIALFAF